MAWSLLNWFVLCVRVRVFTLLLCVQVNAQLTAIDLTVHHRVSIIWPQNWYVCVCVSARVFNVGRFCLIQVCLWITVLSSLSVIHTLYEHILWLLCCIEPADESVGANPSWAWNSLIPSPFIPISANCSEHCVTDLLLFLLCLPIVWGWFISYEPET